MNAKPGLRRRKRQCFEAMIGEWTLRSEWSAEHRLFICKIKQNSDRVASMRVRFGTQKGCDSFGLAANSSGYACDCDLRMGGVALAKHRFACAGDSERSVCYGLSMRAAVVRFSTQSL